MRPMNRSTTLLGALIFGLSPLPAVAQTEKIPEAVISLQCGGIGKDESERMLAEAGMHSLVILFVTADGSYLSDIATRIDEPQKGLSTEALCGPVGLVDVQSPGRYRVTATYNGRAHERWVDLEPRGAARLDLRWAE